MKGLFKALRSATKSPSGPSPKPSDDENASPLPPPKRLLSLTPASRQAAARSSKSAAADGATPARLQYDESKATPRAAGGGRPLQRESSQRIGAVRAGTTPGLTPRPSRFQNDIGAAASAAAAEPAALTADLSDNIKVVVRVRPKNEREGSLGGAVCVQPLSRSTLRIASHPEPHTFAFDHVADERASQDSMFRVAGQPIMENCLAGYNSCIFAYGQTGSGKTHTMLGADGQACDPTDENRGLIQRVFEHLFARIQGRQAADGGARYSLRCSFLEIYNECITDLLTDAPASGSAGLAVREDLRRGVYVEGLREVEVASVDEVVALLQAGAAHRRVAETEMNEMSSRSHSVFTATLECRFSDEFGSQHLRFSRLHLVDLAGSERQKSSGAAGERLREASSINKRDSRLTFLLQDSLGGNAKTCLVATISPAAVNMAETLSTLRFADNAKRIKNKVPQRLHASDTRGPGMLALKAIVNEDLGDAAALRREVKRLREELAALRRGQGQAGGAGVDAAPDPTGTPARIQAAADAMAPTPAAGGGQGAARRALVGALRREDGAVKQVRRLEAEMAGLKDLVATLQADVQRGQMMLKLRDSRLARLQGGGQQQQGGGGDDLAAQELALLRAKLEAHPEVKRFAVENLHLSQELERLAALVDRNELAALHGDLDVLRGEMLALADGEERAQAEAAAAKAALEAARVEAGLAAEAERAKAVAETQARGAAEAAALRGALFEAQRAAREAEAGAAAEAREREEVQARVEMLGEQVAALEAARAAVRQEMSPVKKQAAGLQQELGLLRQQSAAFELRVSSEQQLRSAAELSLGQLQARLGAVEAECAQLRSTNQELYRAKSDAEQERDSVAGVEALCATLKQQLEAERGAVARREAAAAEAAAALEAARGAAAALQAEVDRLQVEALEARQEAARQRDEHEAAQAAAAVRIGDAIRAAAEVQAELAARGARVEELERERARVQAALDELTQRCTELHDEQVRLTSKLAQRDNELMEIEATVDEAEEKLEAARREGAAAAEARRQAEEALAARDAALATASAEAAAAQAQLADATGALADATYQVSELQDRLGAAEAQHAELEYQLSDKSASLREAGEQLARAKAELAAAAAAAEEARAAADVRLAEAMAAADDARGAEREATACCEALTAAADDAEARAAEASGLLEAGQRELAAAQAEAAEALARCAELEAAAEVAARELAETGSALDAAQSRCHMLAAALGAAENAAAEAGTATEAAGARAAALAAQLERAQREAGLEKEQALLLARAELQELKGRLGEEEEAGRGLADALQAKDREIAQIKADMAAEVSEAAQQVQALLAASAQVAALQGEVASLRRRLVGSQADAEAAGQAATLTAAQARQQIDALVRERETWIEELQRERVAASAAMDGVRALERRVEECEAERGALAAALGEAKARAAELEEEVTQLTGQQVGWAGRGRAWREVAPAAPGVVRWYDGGSPGCALSVRIEAHRAQVRLDRSTEELAKLRQAVGKDGLPDFDVEERLREELGCLAADNARLSAQYAALAQAVTALAGAPQQPPTSPASSCEDIVLEFGSPSREGGGGGAEVAAALEAAARRAIEDIRHAQAAAARGIADREQQIRLLQESQRLRALRRANAAESPARR
eukprot:scaffold7.g3515.t1